ncbi:hypothetical protein WI69_23715 [Burkholderia diffusa]|nr:hypothetical protein WI28_18855 [Burkholderia diffusa]KVC13111.1 hypothetical protein WI69_23715 [Burkholderia diffusa]
MMFDRFEADHHVDRGIANGDRCCGAYPVMQIVGTITLLRVDDSILGYIDSDHAACRTSEQRRSVSFATCDIEYVLATTEFCGTKISMQMLEFDVSVLVGHETFAGIFHTSPTANAYRR